MVEAYKCSHCGDSTQNTPKYSMGILVAVCDRCKACIRLVTDEVEDERKGGK